MLYPQTFLSQNIRHTCLITALAYPFSSSYLNKLRDAQLPTTKKCHATSNLFHRILYPQTFLLKINLVLILLPSFPYLEGGEKARLFQNWIFLLNGVVLILFIALNVRSGQHTVKQIHDALQKDF